ncbi:alpha/beta fold hydrolase [Streptomyces sp. NPDC049555]|uniref:thioesterase II family protein n=1 Tax=Streptomyces sp. NPDC049555 TaxID=3154930 RepID=UPI0034299151
MSTNWLRVLRAVAEPRVRLVCFPHAGGTASAFRTWPAGLPDDVEVLAVRYPGREDRIAEPCATRMGEITDAVTAALLALDERPLALFGHSMGASVAYEVAHRLAGEHARVPAALLVSARRAPHRLRPSGTGDLADDALVAHVQGRGAPASAALDHPELRELFLPVLRADYRMLDAYAGEATTRALPVPLTAYYGEQDTGAAEPEALAWAAVAGAGFAARGFAGGHFYLVPHEAALLDDVARRLADTALEPLC